MSLQDLMAKLQKDYLASLPAKIATIQMFWNEVKLEDLEGEFHKMKGTGKTYGIPELSLLAREMESLCATRHPDRIAKGMTIALVLLERVRSERAEGRAFDISSDSSYRTLIMLDRTKNVA